MKKILFLCVIFLFSLNVFSQNSFGLKLAGGVSKITDELRYQKKSDFLPSANFGAFYNYKLYNNFFGIDLLVDHIEGKVFSNYLIRGWYYSDYNMQINSDLNLTYFSFPIYFGIKVDKLSAMISISNSIIIQKKLSMNVIKTDFQNNNVISAENIFDSKYIENSNSSIGLTFLYSIFPNVSAEISGFFGLKTISNYSRINYNTRQITFGIRYFFINM
ncbi:MAG: hypothetical protein JXR68_10500 [Bacteroidales bacterium]|nr:hypothetical protein [Bacteroidales bacterium]